MDLKKLPKEVCSLLRAGVTITNPSQCIAELVTNALDAQATSVAVRVDFRSHKLQVIDNGFGISKKNLDLIGKRYMTSKCHSLTELQGQLGKFGFRGEALASLREVSGLLNISSRAQGCTNTYSKVFAHGKSTSVGQTMEQRPGQGTTVTVQDFLYNMPVRRKRIKEPLDLEEIKSQLESLALVHPKVSFSLRNDASGKLILQTRKGQNTKEAFRNLYGLKLANCLRPIDYTQGKINISGYIGTDVYHQKTLQFIYINKRLVIKTKLNKLINMILAKSFLLKAPGPWLNLPIPKDMNERLGMPLAKKSKYPVFVINLTCPYTDYDITLDPRKTLVQFKNWDEVMHTAEEAVKIFLHKENLTVPSTDMGTNEAAKLSDGNEPSVLDEMDQLDREDVLSGEESASEAAPSHKRRHRPSPQLHIARAVLGLPAKRHKNSKPTSSREPTRVESSFVADAESEAALSSDSGSENPMPASLRVNTALSSKQDDSMREDKVSDDSSSPVNTWAKYKARQKVKKHNDHKKIEVLKTKEKETKNLPDYFEKLQIYSLAANAVKRSFAHHIMKEKCTLKKPATIFSLKHKSSEITPPVKKVNTLPRSTIPQISSLFPQKLASYENNSEDTFRALSIEKENRGPEDVEFVTVQEASRPASHPSIEPLPTSTCSLPVPPVENVAQLPVNHHYQPSTTMTLRNSGQQPLSIEQTKTVIPPNAFLIGSQNKDIPDSEFYHHEYPYGEASDNGQYFTTQQTYESMESKQYYKHWPQETNESRSHEDCTDRWQQQDNYHWASDFSREPHSNCSPVESPQIASSDSSSDENYLKMEARLRCPLEEISREINVARHSMLPESVAQSPLRSPEPETHFSADFLPSKHSSRYVLNDNPVNLNDRKLLELFSYDKRISRSRYEPCSHMNKSRKKFASPASTSSSFPLADTPFSRLNKHITEMENLARGNQIVNPRSYQASYLSSQVEESPTVRQITEMQRLSRLDWSETRTQTSTSHPSSIQLINPVFQGEDEAKSAETHLISYPLEPPSNQFLQNEDMLSSAAVLQQLDPPLSNDQIDTDVSNVINRNILSTASVLHQLGPAEVIEFNNTNPISEISDLFCGDLLSSASVLQHLGPQQLVYSDGNAHQVSSTGEKTGEDLLCSSAVLQKLAPYTQLTSRPSSHYQVSSSTSSDTPASEIVLHSHEYSSHSADLQSTPMLVDEELGRRSTSLVPYSGSSGSDEMDCQISWNSIVNTKTNNKNPHFKSCGPTSLCDTDIFSDGKNSQYHANFESISSQCTDVTNNVVDFSKTSNVSESLNNILEDIRNTSRPSNYAPESSANPPIEPQDFQLTGSLAVPYSVPSTESMALLEGQLKSSKDNKVGSDLKKRCTAVECDIINKKAKLNGPKRREGTVIVSSEESRNFSGKTSEELNVSASLGSKWEERIDPLGRKFYVNATSGITSYQAPVLCTEQLGFSMTPRHSFMPKGSSPLLQIPSGSPREGAVELSCEEQSQLQQAVQTGSSLESELASVKWGNLEQPRPQQTSGFEQLVQKLLSESESTSSLERTISNTCEHNEALVKVHNSLNQYKFSKEMLSTFKVLGQWDNKFVLTAVQGEREQHLLVLFDQHAVHERVRLERLAREYQVNPETSEFRSEEICPPVTLELSSREVRVMLSFHEQFERLGLQFEAVGETGVRVMRVPTCFKLRDERQRGSRGRSLEDLLTFMVREQAHALLQTRGVGARVPPTLQAVLNSEACTGAVKFGDSLSVGECKLLLACLSSCQVPFQCAHGRPVLAPIADLTHLDQAATKVKKPAIAGFLKKLQ